MKAVWCSHDSYALAAVKQRPDGGFMLVLPNSRRGFYLFVNVLPLAKPVIIRRRQISKPCRFSLRISFCWTFDVSSLLRQLLIRPKLSATICVFLTFVRTSASSLGRCPNLAVFRPNMPKNPRFLPATPQFIRAIDSFQFRSIGFAKRTINRTAHYFVQMLRDRVGPLQISTTSSLRWSYFCNFVHIWTFRTTLSV